MLTRRDLTPDGEARQYLAWDTVAAQPVLYDAATGRYDGNTATLPLDGAYRIVTVQGEVVCQPAFALYAALCRRYPPEVVEATGWVPRAQLEGVRVPLQTRHAKHAEPDAHGHPRGFATPSRRIEFYSETFLEHGYAPLPDFIEPTIDPVARPDLVARFPPVLTCAKSTLFCQSQHRALPSLRKRTLDPTVALHPETARARRIAQGDWVAIATPEGSVRARARLNADLDPRVVVGEHGWWQSCAALGAPAYDLFGPEGANFNLLIGSDTLDPISGTASHRAYLCEIRPVA
jgi:anaerobic selenocysteine-containing dehydrogenase